MAMTRKIKPVVAAYTLGVMVMPRSRFSAPRQNRCASWPCTQLSSVVEHHFEFSNPRPLHAKDRLCGFSEAFLAALAKLSLDAPAMSVASLVYRCQALVLPPISFGRVSRPWGRLSDASERGSYPVGPTVRGKFPRCWDDRGCECYGITRIGGESSAAEGDKGDQILPPWRTCRAGAVVGVGKIGCAASAA